MGPMVILQTDRLVLRWLELADAEPLEAVFGDPEVMRFGSGVRTRAWIEDMIVDMRARRYAVWGCGRWAAVERTSGTLIGIAGLTRYPGRCRADAAELGYRLVRSAWGQGFATEAARTIIAHGLGALGLPCIEALIDPGNRASLAVAERAGMRYDREIMLPGYTHPDHVYARSRDDAPFAPASAAGTTV